MGRGVRACVRACMSEPVRGDRGRASDRRRQEAPSAGPPQPPPPPPRDHTPSRADSTHPSTHPPPGSVRSHTRTPPFSLGPEAGRGLPRRQGSARALSHEGQKTGRRARQSGGDVASLRRARPRNPKHPSAVRLPRPGLRPRASGYPTLLSPPGRGGGFNVSYPAL